MSSEFGSINEMECTHNHPVKALQSLSFSDINSLTSQRIKELFEKGYSPAFKRLSTFQTSAIVAMFFVVGQHLLTAKVFFAICTLQ